MNCPHYNSDNTSSRSRLTKLGYKTFYCKNCLKSFNERTGTPFNRLKAKTETIFQLVFWRLRYKLSLRDLSEMTIAQGFELSHETIHNWESEFAPLIAAQLKAKRKGKVGKSWRVDETKIKIKGEWYYLYRSVDGLGNLVDLRLSKVRDLEATEAFFKQAVGTTGRKPEKVTTDGEVSYPKAIRKVLSENVEHRTNQ